MRREKMYLWPDVLWLALALALMLAACCVEPVLDAREEGSPAPEPLPVYAAADVSAVVALELAMAETENPYAEPVTSAAELYVLGAADKLPANVPLTAEETEALVDACEAGHIAPALAFGLIYTESRFDREAVNGPCYGLCQLHTDYFPAGLTSAENIAYGLGYLADQLERYDNLEAALTAYRWGCDNGDRTYAGTVLEAAERFESEVAK